MPNEALRAVGRDRQTRRPLTPCARPRQAKFMDAVIKVFCVHTEPNYSLPWQRKRQYASTSSGFLVSGPEGERWLLTNAHSVEYSSQASAADPHAGLSILTHGGRGLNPACVQ